MSFVQFDLERWQSTWEKQVRFNLSESGVHALSIAELLEVAGQGIEELAHIRMVYNYSDGTVALREAIASQYGGVTPEQITVTVGSSEANFVTCWTLIEPGDRVAVLTPTYMQTHGLARNFGADVSEFWLHDDRGWEPDTEEITRAIPNGTKLVVVTNPNNPTGHVLSNAAREAILDRVRETGAWLLVDEVYRGAELDGHETASFWGSHDRTVIVSGLSKAYGLPGLRIGWIVSSAEFKEAVVRRHDYTVISPGPTADHLATLALQHRDAILARTRRILQTNLPILEAWLQGFHGLFTWQRPECGAICFARYGHPMSALELVEHVRKDCDVLLVPGEHFQLPQHIRIGYGCERAELEEALALLGPMLRELLS
ncbi:MAG: aminotransferase class I/II-fold pyridoxal phosphate-dependent enzyme [Gemmatimonadota bacterium]|nr:aminotransferase class I/II-fold pyridoxal phosphate-dependent enzyme [Gemmatimonadota bacterium]